MWHCTTQLAVAYQAEWLRTASPGTPISCGSSFKKLCCIWRPTCHTSGVISVPVRSSTAHELSGPAPWVYVNEMVFVSWNFSFSVSSSKLCIPVIAGRRCGAIYYDNRATVCRDVCVSQAPAAQSMCCLSLQSESKMISRRLIGWPWLAERSAACPCITPATDCPCFTVHAAVSKSSHLFLSSTGQTIP
jgi:hypothetical protein